MIETSLEVIAVCWAAYNGWRVLATPQNAVEISAEALAKCPTPTAFQAYLRIRDFYLRLSPAHQKYEVSGSIPTNDMVVDVWETAGFQSVKHQYRVAAFVPNERMALVSEKTQVCVFGLFKAQSRSEVEFRFRPADGSQTILGLTIRIGFPNRLRHLLARLFFTEAIWQAHARQEIRALARIVEQNDGAEAV